jgi:hypothetical protein
MTASGSKATSGYTQGTFYDVGIAGGVLATQAAAVPNFREPLRLSPDASRPTRLTKDKPCRGRDGRAWRCQICAPIANRGWKGDGNHPQKTKKGQFGSQRLR